MRSFAKQSRKRPRDPLAELDNTNTKLTDFVNESRQFASTSEIARFDARRDAYFKAMWRALEQLEELGEDVPMGADAQDMRKTSEGSRFRCDPSRCFQSALIA